jgi:hypothetical protein
VLIQLWATGSRYTNQDSRGGTEGPRQTARQNTPQGSGGYSGTYNRISRAAVDHTTRKVPVLRSPWDCAMAAEAIFSCSCQNESAYTRNCWLKCWLLWGIPYSEMDRVTTRRGSAS